jgi:putative tryptophan/tyrosine transport system substrate-binding protein
MIRRREFIAGLGSAAAWPVVARAQQGERVRRIGVIMTLAADDPEALRRRATFVQGLQELGSANTGRFCCGEFSARSSNWTPLRR